MENRFTKGSACLCLVIYILKVLIKLHGVRKKRRLSNNRKKKNEKKKIVIITPFSNFPTSHVLSSSSDRIFEFTGSTRKSVLGQKNKKNKKTQHCYTNNFLAPFRIKKQKNRSIVVVTGLLTFVLMVADPVECIYFEWDKIDGEFWGAGRGVCYFGSNAVTVIDHCGWPLSKTCPNTCWLWFFSFGCQNKR